MIPSSSFSALPMSSSQTLLSLGDEAGTGDETGKMIVLASHPCPRILAYWGTWVAQLVKCLTFLKKTFFLHLFIF